MRKWMLMLTVRQHTVFSDIPWKRCQHKVCCSKTCTYQSASMVPRGVHICTPKPPRMLAFELCADNKPMVPLLFSAADTVSKIQREFQNSPHHPTI